MAIGIIGTGNMGTILTEAIIEGGVGSPSDIFVTNRTLEKAYFLKEHYSDINIVNHPKDVVSEAEVLFICIKPLDIKPLLDQVSDDLTKNHLVISITSPITVDQIESAIPSKVARMIPSITNRALGGATLLTFGKRCGDVDRRLLWELASKFSEPIEIDESVTRVASDLSSCGPAFVGYLLEQMIDAAVSETKISKEQATALTTEMMIGFGQLLEKNVYSLETLRKKVHVKGGVTGEGLKVMEEELGDVFHHLFQKTQEKFREDHELVDQQFE